MSVSGLGPLSSAISNLLNTEPVKNDTGLGGSGSFEDIFRESFQTVAETDTTDKLSSLELLAGEADDMSGLMLDAQKAEISLNLALQIRNKALDAYDTVMRMSI